MRSVSIRADSVWELCKILTREETIAIIRICVKLGTEDLLGMNISDSIKCSFSLDITAQAVEVQMLTEKLSLNEFEMLGHAILEHASRFKTDIARGFELTEGDPVLLPVNQEL